jgi:hypothetical protein
MDELVTKVFNFELLLPPFFGEARSALERKAGTAPFPLPRQHRPPKLGRNADAGFDERTTNIVMVTLATPTDSGSVEPYPRLDGYFCTKRDRSRELAPGSDVREPSGIASRKNNLNRAKSRIVRSDAL